MELSAKFSPHGLSATAWARCRTLPLP